MIGGNRLIEMRMAGARPPGFIVVTEDRQVARNARARGLYPLIFDPKETDDWTVVRGLNVRVCTNLRREQIQATTAVIFHAEPLTLACTYYDDDPRHETVIPYAAR